MKTKVNVSVTPDDIVKAKFVDTISILAAHIKEAESVEFRDSSYSGKAIVNRLKRIKEALDGNIMDMSDAIELGK